MERTLRRCRFGCCAGDAVRGGGSSGIERALAGQAVLSLSPGPTHAHSASDAWAAIYRMGPSVWERLAGGLPQPLSHLPCRLLTVPTAPGHVCFGLANGDVWHSADHGDTWSLLPFSLGAIHRATIALT